MVFYSAPVYKDGLRGSVCSGDDLGNIALFGVSFDLQRLFGRRGGLRGDVAAVIGDGFDRKTVIAVRQFADIRLGGGFFVRCAV